MVFKPRAHLGLRLERPFALLALEIDPVVGAFIPILLKQNEVFRALEVDRTMQSLDTLVLDEYHRLFSRPQQYIVQ